MNEQHKYTVQTNELKTFSKIEDAIAFAKEQPKAIVFADCEYAIVGYFYGHIEWALHGWFRKNNINMSIL